MEGGVPRAALVGQFARVVQLINCLSRFLVGAFLCAHHFLVCQLVGIGVAHSLGVKLQGRAMELHVVNALLRCTTAKIGLLWRASNSHWRFLQLVSTMRTTSAAHFATMSDSELWTSGLALVRFNR